MTSNTPDLETTDPPSSISNLNISALSFADDAYARQLAANVGDLIREIGKALDLSSLDGVTIANDYSAALATIDFGFPRANPPKPTTEGGTGIAMHLGVLRDGIAKSHIVLNAHYLNGLHDFNQDTTKQCIHTVFHECAHVEVAAMFETRFPGRSVNPKYLDHRDAYRWQSALTSWDEYAACRLSSKVCPADHGYYAPLLAEAIDSLSGRISLARSRFTEQRSVAAFMVDMYSPCSDVMRFAAYNLGHLHGRDLSLADLPELSAQVSNSEAKPIIDRLEAACLTLWSGYGKWPDDSGFISLGNIVDDMVAMGGLKYGHGDDGRPCILPLE